MKNKLLYPISTRLINSKKIICTKCGLLKNPYQLGVCFTCYHKDDENKVEVRNAE